MSNSIDYTRLNIVGDAVEGAWNLNANPMTSIDRGVFTWTGTLTADRPFKFMNSDDGWHKHVVATSKDEIIKDGEIHHLDFYADWTLPDALDNKFMVNETGVYVLTVDLRHMSVRLSRQQPATVYPDKYYITGSALDDNVIEMDKIGNFEFKQSLPCSPRKHHTDGYPNPRGGHPILYPGIRGCRHLVWHGIFILVMRDKRC